MSTGEFNVKKEPKTYTCFMSHAVSVRTEISFQNRNNENYTKCCVRQIIHYLSTTVLHYIVFQVAFNVIVHFLNVKCIYCSQFTRIWCTSFVCNSIAHIAVHVKKKTHTTRWKQNRCGKIWFMEKSAKHINLTSIMWFNATWLLYPFYFYSENSTVISELHHTDDEGEQKSVSVLYRDWFYYCDMLFIWIFLQHFHIDLYNNTWNHSHWFIFSILVFHLISRFRRHKKYWMVLKLLYWWLCGFYLRAYWCQRMKRCWRTINWLFRFKKIKVG